MPAHEEHCLDSLKKYGKRFDELHRWMDEPWEVLGKKHRMYRHDPYTTPQEAKKIFGEYADHACLDHIRLDYPGYFELQHKAGMDTDFCIHWQGDKTARWCRECKFGEHEEQPCYDLWKMVRSLAAMSLTFTNNRPGKAFGNRYRLESPSLERCYLKMLQGKMSRFQLPKEDFLYVVKTGSGGMNQTPSKTRQNPFVDLLIEIITNNPDIPNGAIAVDGVRKIPRKGSEENIEHELGKESEPFYYDEKLLGPDESHYWGPPLKVETDKAEEIATRKGLWKRKIKLFFARKH